jgi:hypothetical protein
MWEATAVLGGNPHRCTDASAVPYFMSCVAATRSPTWVISTSAAASSPLFCTLTPWLVHPPSPPLRPARAG